MQHRSPLFDWSDALVDRLAAVSPIHASFAGVAGWEDRWDDASPEGVVDRRAFWASARQELLAWPGALDGPDRLARDVILDCCEANLRFIDTGGYHTDLNSLASTLQAPILVISQADIQSTEAADALIARLDGVERLYAGYRDTLWQGAGLGRAVAARQVRAAIAQTAVYGGPASAFVSRAREAAALHPDRAAALEAAAARATAACRALGRWLGERYLPLAPEADAVGEERYAEAARWHLGAELDLRAAHDWGVSEVLRIEAAMAELCRALGGGAVPEVIAALSKDPTRCASNAEEFLDRMAARQAQAVEALAGVHFDVPPELRRIDVRRAPPGGPIGAYYSAPSEDFSRPGTIFYSLEREEMIPLFPEISTAHHEGFPGHHLHIATSKRAAGQLSRFQRLMVFSTGHAEGWALYAERLMWELGLLERPEYVLGMYIQELVRAWRVVLDIGLHLSLPIAPALSFHAGEIWSVPRVEEALATRAFLAPGAAASNALRYAGFPGQAIAYKLGQRVILEARDALRGRPGFDRRAFHARAVGSGSLGLARLAAHLRAPAPDSLN